MITPAISVLSAVEGVKVIDPDLADLVVPITVVILIGLFAVQRHGTAAVGRFFGPVMIVWFAVIGFLGARGITTHPQILRALSPSYALEFMTGHFHIAFFALAAVVLSVTGAEALYADMGHFGRRAITPTWLGLVLPAVVLSYFGQGALLLGDPSVVNAPFFLLVPDGAQIAMIVLSTAATVIASQSVITGAYSVASQAAQIGYLPRMRIAHTSESAIGQIYVPWINGMLMISVITLVFAFRSSAALGYAYGMAVTGTITITTMLFLYVARVRWHAPVWLVILGGGGLLTVDLLFFAANLTKLMHGAWLPLLIGLMAFTVMTTWRRGYQIAMAARDKAAGSLPDFVCELAGRTPPLPRLPGTAVFLNRARGTAPLSLRASVDRVHVLQGARGDHHGRDPAGAAGFRRRSRHRRRPRQYRGRRHRLRGGPLRLAWNVPTYRMRSDWSIPPRPKGSRARRSRVLRLQPEPVRRAGTEHGGMAQTVVHRDLPDDLRRRVLRAAGGPDTDHRRQDRTLKARGPPAGERRVI